jgi:hypothetical protein
MRTVNINSRASSTAMIGLLLLLLWALPMMAQAQEEAQEEGPSEAEDRPDPSTQWISSIAIHTGATLQDWNGDANSTLFPGPGAADPTPVPIRPTVSGSDLDVSAVVGASLELMTPELPIPLRPRFIAGFEVIPIFGTQRTIAGEGDPGPQRPPLPSADPGMSIPFDEDLVIGQGTKLTGEMDEVAWGAYLGMSFPFELFDRSLRIKPNLSYMRYEVDFKGFISDATCVNPAPFGGPTVCNALGSSTRDISLNVQRSRVFHALGPGIDLEMDTTVFDEVRSSIFLGFRAYRVLTDRKVDLETTETFDDGIGTGDVANARFRAEVDDWIYRLVFGFRIELNGFLD